MGEDTSRNDISCKKYRPEHEYSHIQVFIDNLPYMVMVILGGIILLISLEMSLLGWIAACLFIMYGIIGSFWIIVFVCPYCHFYDTTACPCGYGKIAAKIRTKKEGNEFIKKFKKHIPVIVPLWIIPVLAGGIAVMEELEWVLFVLLMAFIINSFIILPLISRKYGCAHCPQKETCPWMGRR